MNNPAWHKLNSGTMTYSPTLSESYQVCKVITNFEGGQVTTYQALKVLDNGLLFMCAGDSFAECKNYIELSRNDE